MQCENTNGELVHSVFSSVKCWKELHILHAVFGLISVIVFVGISLVVVLTLFETKSSSNDASARTHSRNEFYQNVFKFISVILTTFFTYNDFRWVLAIYMLIGSIVLYIKFKNEKPYYNDIANRIIEVTYCLFMWACFCLIIVLISENSSFNGGMQAFIMAVPLIGIIIITRTSRRQILLLKNLEDFDNPEEWFLKIRYYIDIVQHKEINREAAVQLNGFMFHHEESCINVNCPIKAYTSALIASLKDKKKKQTKAGNESFVLLMSYAKQLFSQGITKFPASGSLHIAYALFLKDRLNDRTTAISELTSAEKCNPQFDEQFMIYRYRKILEDETTELTESGGASLDVVSMLAYENYLQKCKEAIEKSAYLHMEFWLELLELEPDLGKLDTTGIRINATIVQVQEHWEKLQKINPNVPKALKLYADYLVEILNDAEEGTELLARAKDNELVKNNYASNLVGDAAALGMGELCATMGGADGTPCIIASGDSGKVGDIMQFNLSACRIFGYTKAELTGKKINILMPELYAKFHDSVLQHAIENVENMGLTTSKSDKFVLGRHKSGYLLPLPVQARVVISVKQGAFFVACFKSDKKGLNVTYLLLNEHQDIIGVSSKAIESIGLTNHILRNYRVSALTLAPGLADKSMAGQFASKTGGTVDFYRPDITQEADANNVSGISKSGESNIEAQNKKLRIKASKKFTRMNCIMTEVAYNTHTYGYVVRLEPAEDQKIALGSLKQEKGQINFQFAFDPMEMKYIQQNCEEDAQKLIADEMSSYVNILRDRSGSSFTANKSDESRDNSASGMEVKKEQGIADLQKIIEMKRKQYAEGIDTYRWIDGRREKVQGAQSRLLERQREEQKELEELHTKEKSDMKKDDIFNVLKSKKIFNDTLNDRTIPSAVQKLKYAGYIIVLLLIALASTEFGLAITQYKDIGENIQLVRDSYRQIVSQMRMVFYISKIVLLNKREQPYLLSNITNEEILKGKKYIESALEEYYETQNSISLSTISMSSEHTALFKGKNVYLYYVNSSEEANSDKYYTLPEAIQQMASEVFTVLSFTNETKYSIYNDNVYFVLYNSFSDLYAKMKTSANFFVQELSDRGNDKVQVMLIIYIVSLTVIILSIIVLFPIVAGVSQSRLAVLALFFDLPQATVRELQKKCERFVAQSKDEEIEGMSANESNAGLIDMQGKIEGNFTNTGNAQTGHKRRYKNNKSSNSAFYLNFGITMLIIAGYFSVNFAFGYIYLKSVNGYSRELNATAVSHEETSHSIAVFQELLGYGRLFTMSPAETFDYLALRKITDLYAIAQETQISHNENGKSFTEDYQDSFMKVMRNNICDYKDKFQLSDDCTDFLEGTTKEGLHPVYVNFIEATREMLTAYKTILSKNWSQERKNEEIGKTLLSSSQFSDMEKSVYEIIDAALRFLVDELIGSYDTRSGNDMTQRVILYVSFLLCFFIGYLALWSPFTNKLSNEVYF